MADTQIGSLTVVQRFGSSLNLNVHFHVIAMDGVYGERPDGSMLFHPLPAPSDEAIARLAVASVASPAPDALGMDAAGADKGVLVNPGISISPSYLESADCPRPSF